MENNVFIEKFPDINERTFMMYMVIGIKFNIYSGD